MSPRRRLVARRDRRRHPRGWSSDRGGQHGPARSLQPIGIPHQLYPRCQWLLVRFGVVGSHQWTHPLSVVAPLPPLVDLGDHHRFSVRRPGRPECRCPYSSGRSTPDRYRGPVRTGVGPDLHGHVDTSSGPGSESITEISRMARPCANRHCMPHAPHRNRVSRQPTNVPIPCEPQSGQLCGGPKILPKSSVAEYVIVRDTFAWGPPRPRCRIPL